MSMRSVRWHPNALVLPRGGGIIRIFQPDARRNILATLPIIKLIDACSANFIPVAELAQLYAAAQGELKVADATEFSLFENAFRNSAMYGDEKALIPEMEELPFEDFLELFLESAVLTESWPPVDDFGKRSFADRHRGSFNEQIATESLFARTTPSDWWVRQKFTEDALNTRPTPYKYIQEKFLDEYFSTRLAGKSVLEIGCGTGYQTRKIARSAASVVGMDYNQNYLDIARSRWPLADYPNLRFEFGDIIDLSAGSGFFKGKEFDFIFLIDTFLFVFDAKFQPMLHSNREVILDNIRKLLAPGGLLVIMDPHFLWHTSWAGSETRPVGFITEYKNRRFKEIASLQEYMDLFHHAGFVVQRLYEPTIDEEYKRIDPQGYAFMREFPQWLAWELAVGKQI